MATIFSATDEAACIKATAAQPRLPWQSGPLRCWPAHRRRHQQRRRDSSVHEGRGALLCSSHVPAASPRAPLLLLSALLLLQSSPNSTPARAARHCRRCAPPASVTAKTRKHALLWRGQIAAFPEITCSRSAALLAVRASSASVSAETRVSRSSSSSCDSAAAEASASSAAIVSLHSTSSQNWT